MSNANIEGKVIRVLDLVTGTSKGSGNEWKKRSFIMETGGQYPKKICFTAWGDKVDILPNTLGAKVDVTYRVESREFNDRWYTDVVASEIVIKEAAQGGQSNSAPSQGAPSAAPPSIPPQDDEDDMPF